VVKLAFLQRRKVMNNAIKPMLGNYEGGNEWLDKVLRLRAEALSVEDFIELTKVLKVLNNG
jgi:16S rRNA A1518/A1519 N6-dimethyltransferase RsmA/KsgA/DIM1 with predicted DNA glycosylase/AP lyase activity